MESVDVSIGRGLMIAEDSVSASEVATLNAFRNDTSLYGSRGNAIFCIFHGEIVAKAVVAALETLYGVTRNAPVGSRAALDKSEFRGSLGWPPKMTVL